MSRLFDLAEERGILRASIAATLAIALLGIVLGLASGSHAVVFDAVYSLVDCGMCLLSLAVASLIAADGEDGKLPNKLRARFTMGFWHLEPMVLAFNGMLLIGIVVYALIDAVQSLIEGGRSPSFGLAITYAAITLVVCLASALVAVRANRRANSEFVRLDIKGWIMAAAITAAMLAAFVLALTLRGTAWAPLVPYADPAILATVCLVLLPMPIPTLRTAFADILLVTPTGMREKVETICAEFATRHALASHHVAIARSGRRSFIEITFLVPPETTPRAIVEWDRMRDELGAVLGETALLTVTFTGDPRRLG
jgi:predicted Co/Zn/Cd cation transporter (cation efflux family)